MPSLSDLLFVVIFLSLCFTDLSVKLLNDAGIGWHIRTGQQILTTHQIPHTDSFSSIMTGKPWIAWEWLYDVIVGALHSALGLNGVVWFTAIIVAATFAWTFKLMIARGTNLLLALILILLAISASMIHILARPHVLSWLFVVLWFSVLDSSEREALQKHRASSRWLWFLPLVMVVWVNLHGGFLLGLILCAIYWLSAMWSWRIPPASFQDNLVRLALGKRVRDLSLITLLCFAATFVNPYGWALHRHIFSYLRDSYLMDHIDEFQSPNFHGVAQKCFLGLLLIAIVLLAVRKRDLRTSELLLFIFAVYAGLYASRNIPVACILLALASGALWAPVHFAADLTQRMAAVNAGLRGHAWPFAAVIFVLLVNLNGGSFAGKVLANAHFDRNRMPVAAVDSLMELELSEPVLTPDYWGGYLIYRLYPKIKVVLDDRHDLYRDQILAAYLKTLRAQPGWDEFLRDYHVTCLLMPKNAAITAILSHTSGWKLVYSDNVAVIFVRADSRKVMNPPRLP